jgi:hypothetical protein
MIYKAWTNDPETALKFCAMIKESFPISDMQYLVAQLDKGPPYEWLFGDLNHLAQAKDLQERLKMFGGMIVEPFGSTVE